MTTNDGGRASDPFIHILGHVRSGTTMLRAMLDSHAELSVPPESYFVVPMLESATRLDVDFDIAKFIANIEADKYFDDWQLPNSALDPLRTDGRINCTADAIAGLYATYALEHNKPRYADKTPSHLWSVALLAKNFLNARFLHIVRDGRDVTSSVLTMDFGPDQFATVARSWRRKIMAAHIVGVGLGPDKYREIKYETLVADPAAVLEEACIFLGLPYDDGMLRYHERAEEILEGLRHTAHIQGIRKPPTVGVRDWRADLTPYQVAVFDEIAGEALDALGYERSVYPSSLRTRARAHATELKMTLRRARRVTTRRVMRRLKPKN